MNNLKDLHDRDFNLWTEQMAIAIKNRDVNNMDWDNLLEEIQDMGASEKRALRSYYYRLVEYILKLRDWRSEKEKNQANWSFKILTLRREIKGILEDSPSLQKYLQENHNNWFIKVTNDICKSELFLVEDVTAIPLAKMLDDNFFT